MTASAVQERLSSLEILAQHGFRPVKVQESRPKDRYLFLCPFHADTHPSFSVHEECIRWTCWVCGSGGPRELLRRFGDDYSPPVRLERNGKKSKFKGGSAFTGCTTGLLEKTKHFPAKALQSFGCIDYQYLGKPVIAIPYANGAIRYRVGLEGKDRFRWRSGSKVSIYGIDKLEAFRSDRCVLFVEGETDSWAGWLMGLPVLGIPGVGTLKQVLTAEQVYQFQGCQIYAWKEPGQAGETFVEKLGQAFWDIMIIDAPPGIKDLAELRDQAGEGAREFFEELKAGARRWRQLGSPKNVPTRDKGVTLSTYIPGGDISPNRWEQALKHYPANPKVPHAGKYTARWNARKGCLGIFKGYANTWHHPENKNQKLRLLYDNILPKLERQSIYMKYIPVDDWSDRLHDAIEKRVSRAGVDHCWLSVDNGVRRGYHLYLSTAALKGWELCTDVEPVFAESLKAIYVPDMAEGKFQPVRGGKEWTKGATRPNIRDWGEWEDIAYAAGDVVDLDAIWAEARARMIACEEVSRPFWPKTQIGSGHLFFFDTWQEAVDFILPFGFQPKKSKGAINDDYQN